MEATFEKAAIDVTTAYGQEQMALRVQSRLSDEKAIHNWLQRGRNMRRDNAQRVGFCICFLDVLHSEMADNAECENGIIFEKIARLVGITHEEFETYV